MDAVICRHVHALTVGIQANTINPRRRTYIQADYIAKHAIKTISVQVESFVAIFYYLTFIFCVKTIYSGDAVPSIPLSRAQDVPIETTIVTMLL